jgi:O-antigen/teichoic acid export membrane protein
MGQRVTSLITGFGSFFILVRLLSKDDLGSWALFASVTALIEVARGGLIQNAQIKYCATASTEEYPKILTASLSLNVMVTLFSIIVLTASAHFMSVLWNSPQLETMFYLYSITTFILILYYQFNFIQQSNLDFKGIFYSNLIRQGTLFLFIFFAWLYEHEIKLYELVWMMSLGAFLGTVLSYFFVKNYWKITYKIEWTWVKKLFHYGKYVFGTNISSMIYTSIDQMMLGYLMPVSSVAVFNTANRVTNFVEVPLSSVAAIVFPQSAKRIETHGKEAVTYLYERSVGLLVAMILPVAIICLLFSEWIIIIIAGREYLEAAPILQVIIIATLIQPYIRQFGTTMDSIGKPKKNFYLLVFIAVINICTNYLFISTLGLIGAAFGTLTALIIFLIISQIILNKELNIKFHHTFIYMWRFYVDAFHMGLKVLKTGKLKG